MKCQFCGATRSRSKKPFDKETLKQHERTCRKQERDSTILEDELGDEDTPDGAYFAMAAEQGEWW